MPYPTHAHPRRERTNAILHEPTPPLLRHRSTREDPVRLHPRPRRPAARPHPGDQPALQPPGLREAHRLPEQREGVADHFEDRVVRKSVAVDLALQSRYDTLLTDLENYLVRQAKQHDPQAFHLLRRVPGVGKGKALSILAHKLGRAAYYILLRGKAFEIDRFVATVN